MLLTWSSQVVLFTSYPNKDESLSLKVQGLDFWAFAPSEFYRSLFLPLLGVSVDCGFQKNFRLEKKLMIGRWEIKRPGGLVLIVLLPCHVDLGKAHDLLRLRCCMFKFRGIGLDGFKIPFNSRILSFC